MIFDTHCHLNSPELLERIDEVISNAKEVGVTRFLVVGWDKESSLTAIELANKYECVYAAIGYHPTDVIGITDEELDNLFQNLNNPKVVAVGEIGLDYHWVEELDKRAVQQQMFIKQIEIANKYKKPISIHNRDAFKDCLDILKEHKPLYGGVVHCYSGSVEYLKNILDLGLSIGLDGPLTFKNSKTPKEVCAVVPLDKLVVETDCPYLSPHPLRGTLNEPKNLPYIIKEIASIKNITVEEVSEITYKNGLKLFGID